jgi:hypothetical protein
MINQMFGSSYISVKKACLLVYANCVQNNTLLQVASLDMGGFTLLERFIKEKEDVGLKETYFTALSALVRGQFLAVQRLFIDKGGIELLLAILGEPKTSLRLKRKAELFLKDLIHMDQHLHFATIERDVMEEVKVNDRQSSHFSLKKTEGKDEKEPGQKSEKTQV